jgi:hypothetical protein
VKVSFMRWRLPLGAGAPRRSARATPHQKESKTHPNTAGAAKITGHENCADPLPTPHDRRAGASWWGSWTASLDPL